MDNSKGTIVETVRGQLARTGAYLAALCTVRNSLLLLVILILTDWGVTGVTAIREDEQGVVTRFGAVTRVAPSGILFTLPWPIENVIAIKTTEVRTMPVGYKLVDAIRGIPPSPAEATANSQSEAWGRIGSRSESIPGRRNTASNSAIAASVAAGRNV